MAHPVYHADRSAARFGGKPADYQPIHDWFDASKAHMPDLRHRALRHHSEGIFLAEAIFGSVIVNADGRRVPVRLIAEQHVMDDLGWIPSVKDWLQHLEVQPWMTVSPWRPAREEALKATCEPDSSGQPQDRAQADPLANEDQRA